jgi:hypothetical protein
MMPERALLLLAVTSGPGVGYMAINGMLLDGRAWVFLLVWSALVCFATVLDKLPKEGEDRASATLGLGLLGVALLIMTGWFAANF